MRGIVVEGADGNGKSYLVRQLSEDLSIEYKTCGPPPASFNEYNRWLMCQRDCLESGNVILDRHTPLSCYAYYGINKMIVVERVLITHSIATNISTNPLYVLCVADNHKIDKSKSYKTSKYIDTVDTLNSEITKRYYQLFEALSVTPIVYNWQQDSYTDLLNRIQKCITRNKASST